LPITGIARDRRYRHLDRNPPAECAKDRFLSSRISAFDLPQVTVDLFLKKDQIIRMGRRR